MKVTVIAAGFDRRKPNRAPTRSGAGGGSDDLDIPNFVQG